MQNIQVDLAPEAAEAACDWPVNRAGVGWGGPWLGPADQQEPR
jgi:hypothetical protein